MGNHPLISRPNQTTKGKQRIVKVGPFKVDSVFLLVSLKKTSQTGLPSKKTRPFWFSPLSVFRLVIPLNTLKNHRPFWFPLFRCSSWFPLNKNIRPKSRGGSSRATSYGVGGSQERFWSPLLEHAERGSSAICGTGILLLWRPLFGGRGGGGEPSGWGGRVSVFVGLRGGKAQEEVKGILPPPKFNVGLPSRTI